MNSYLKSTEEEDKNDLKEVYCVVLVVLATVNQGQQDFNYLIWKSSESWGFKKTEEKKVLYIG